MAGQPGSEGRGVSRRQFVASAAAVGMGVAARGWTEPRAAVPAYGAPVAGWYGNPHADLALAGGALVVECSGGDPSITTRRLPEQPGPFVLELRMRSRSTGPGQALWATGAQPGFARPRSVFFTVTHDGEWRDYQVALPVATAITSLRLDPCMAPGRVEIARIRLLSRAGAVAHEWRW